MSRTVGSTATGSGPLDDARVVEAEGQSSVVLDGGFLFSADFVRFGDDLLLRGEDGSEILLRDYFDQDSRPTLETADGARLQPETVEALAAPETVLGYAQAGGLQLGQPVGEVSLLNGTARVQRPDGTRADLNEGDPIFQGDVVSTGVGSELGIAFVDETVFSLSANARMVINELIYNPGSTANSMGVSLIQGTFVFVTGQVAPNGGMLVDTPVGTIGIRGTTVGVEIATLGGRTVIANLTNPDTGETGSFLFSNNAGDALFSLANHYLEIRSANVDPGVPSIASGQAIASAFGRALNTAVSIQRQLFQQRQEQDGPTDQQEGQLQGEPLQAVQQAGLTQEQIDALLNDPVIETAAGPQAGDGGTSVPSSGSGFGGGLQFESVTNNNSNGTLGGSLGGASEPLPPVGDPGTPPPPPSGALPGEGDDDTPPPPPPPSANEPPAVTVGGGTGEEGGLVPITAANLQASDAETTDPAQLVYTVTAASNGFVVLIVGESVQVVFSFTQADVDAGRVFFAHDGSDTTLASFTVRVADADGGQSAPKTVQLAIEPENDAPELTNNALEVGAGDTVVLTSDDLSASDDGGNEGALVFTVSGVSGGQFELASAPGVAVTSFTQQQVIDGEVVFVDDGDETPPSYSVSVGDGELSTEPAPAEVVFTPENTAPDAVDDLLFGGEDGVISGNVLADNGGGGPDSDPDGHPLTVTAVNGNPAAIGLQIVLESGALLTLNADGTFSYDPNGAFDYLPVEASAEDSFTYTISDGNGGTDTATVTVTVGGTNDAPTAVDDAFTAEEDSLVGGDVLGIYGGEPDSDPEDDFLEVTAVDGNADAVGVQIALESGALLTLNDDGTFIYDPNGQFDWLQAGETASDSFTYTVSDGNGGTDTATVTVTVEGANDAPQVVTSPGAVGAGAEVVITAAILSATDPDNADPADITFTVSDQVDGVVQLDGVITSSFTLADVIAGSVTFVHDGGDNATAGFSVVASDPLGGSSEPATVNLTVASGFVWTNAAGTDDWDDPANWLEGAVPPAGANVTIPSVGSAIFSTGALLLDSLHLAGGTLEVTGGALGTTTMDGEGGTLLVDGGQFNVAAQNDPMLAVGSGAGSLANAAVQNGGEIAITGTQATLTVGGESDTQTPVSIFTISSGGQVLLDGQGGSATVYVGGTAESLGAIFVTGEGSALTVEGNAAGVFVGEAGLGELLIDDGGVVSALYLEVGSFAEGFGLVLVGAGDDVSGSRSELRIAGQFTEGGGAFVQVGGNGTGSLQVVNGALMSIDSAGADPSLVIGAGSGGVGTVLVSGTGSELILSNGGNTSPANHPFIAVGREGEGALAIFEGGKVVNAANGYTFVGLDPNGIGTVVVGGDSVAGSLFDAGEMLVIGAGYNFPNDEILFEAGGSGSVTVGAGGTLRAGTAQGDGIDDIFIGTGGTLTIQNGSTVIGDIRNEGGTLINGNSPGTAHFGGDFSMTNGTLEVELGGLEEGAFDLYKISGEAAMNGGTIEFVLLDGYDPLAGDTFDFLAADGGLSADEASLSFVFRGVGAGFDFAVDFSANGVSVSILNDAGAGNSVVFRGSDRAESFAGSDGNDRLDGGAGADTLSGGAGADLFVLRSEDAGASIELADVITDFEVGADRLALTGGLTTSDVGIGETAGGDAAIMLQSSGAILAVLQGVSAAGLSLEEIATAA